MTGSAPGERLERALQAFLGNATTNHAERERLLANHPDLHDLLEPMLRGPTNGQAPAGDERVLGDYRLVRELGRGGMGVVYEAWQRSLDRRVAVKVLSAATTSTPAALARFRREATSAARLRHPNIVEVYGFGEADGEHFFAMQYVDGAPLHDVADRFRSEPAALALAGQLVDALVHAHQAGIVHRDVKPANVLVTADGHAYLSDFGVARDDTLPSLTRDGGFLGTLDYASPEQVRGETVDARTDVWAVGVLLHELVSGRHPFTAPTQEATLHRILGSEPPSLRGRPGISDDFAAVVDRALAKTPGRRYASAAALAADLQALARGEPVSVRLPGVTERMRRWVVREPWRAFAALSLAVCLPLATGVLGYLWANAGRIAAATDAELRAEREERLSSALQHLADGEAAEGLRSLADAPDETEVAVLRALLHVRADAPAAARAALAGHRGAVVDLMQRYVERPLHVGDVATRPPGDPFECFVRAFVLLEGAKHRGKRPRPLAEQALALARLAILLAPAPRLNYLATLAAAADELDDLKTIEPVLHAIAHDFPNSRTGKLLRARHLARLRPAEALPLLDELERDQPPSASSLATRAVAFEYAGRLAEAVEWNRRALAADAGHYIALYNRATCERKLKQRDAATASYREFLERRPYYAPAWNGLALTRRDAGDAPGAIAAFRTALEVNPDYGSAALNLGNLLSRSGDLAGAETALRQAVAADPGNVRAIANLGDALAKAGRREEALPLAMRAADLAPNDLVPNYNVASLALTLGLPKLALPAAERACSASKESAQGLEILAKALLGQEPVDATRALATARAADAKHGGKHLDTRILVARALDASGDRAGAVRALQAIRADARFRDHPSLRDVDELLERLAK